MSKKALPPVASINITLSIIELKCTHFQFTEYAVSNKKPILFEGGYEFTFTLNFKVLEFEKRAIVTIESGLFEKQSENIKIELAEIKIEGTFNIQNFDEIIKKDKSGTLQIPNQLIGVCNNICIHGLRGMYSVKLENSLYSNAVMPLMSANLFAPQKK